jgi:hypothetical protein
MPSTTTAGSNNANNLQQMQLLQSRNPSMSTTNNLNHGSNKSGKGANQFMFSNSTTGGIRKIDRNHNILAASLSVSSTSNLRNLASE